MLSVKMIIITSVLMLSVFFQLSLTQETISPKLLQLVKTTKGRKDFLAYDPDHIEKILWDSHSPKLRTEQNSQ